jgi:hypothetical protein
VRLGIGAVSALLVAVVLIHPSPVIRAVTPSAHPDRVSPAVGPSPGIRLEAEAATLDPEGWSELLRAVGVAVDGEPDVFPAAAIVSLPDLNVPWEPEGVPTVRMGIWGTGGTTRDGPMSGASASLARTV